MKSFCSQLLLDTNNAIINTNNTYLEWNVDFGTILQDDFQIGGLYNIVYTSITQGDGSTALAGLFTLESPAMIFMHNVDFIDGGSNGRYERSNKGTFPYVTNVAGIAMIFSNYGYTETVRITSARSIVRMQHYLASQNYVLNNSLTTIAPHLISFDIYRIDE